MATKQVTINERALGILAGGSPVSLADALAVSKARGGVAPETTFDTVMRDDQMRKNLFAFHASLAVEWARCVIETMNTD